MESARTRRRTTRGDPDRWPGIVCPRHDDQGPPLSGTMNEVLLAWLKRELDVSGLFGPGSFAVGAGDGMSVHRCRDSGEGTMPGMVDQMSTGRLSAEQEIARTSSVQR
ncbi:hypothetical protein ACQEU3_43815 [Spirillospora sp. CA-253888]